MLALYHPFCVVMSVVRVHEYAFAPTSSIPEVQLYPPPV